MTPVRACRHADVCLADLVAQLREAHAGYYGLLQPLATEPVDWDWEAAGEAGREGHGPVAAASRAVSGVASTPAVAEGSGGAERGSAGAADEAAERARLHGRVRAGLRLGRRATRAHP